MGTLTSWNPLGHSRPVTRLLYLYYFNIITVPILNIRHDTAGPVSRGLSSLRLQRNIQIFVPGYIIMYFSDKCIT
jgi:hypothetical protein